MGLIRKLVAGKLVAKAVQKMNQKAAATAATSRAYAGEYIPAAGGARTGLANKAVAFYERNPKLVTGAATLLLAALAAGLSKGRKLH